MVVKKKEQIPFKEKVVVKKSHKTIFTVFLIVLIAMLVFTTIKIVKRKEERNKIDTIVSEIQNEIFIKQCTLNKMYCCNYKDKPACDKWVEANCAESDGSLNINCEISILN